MPKLSRLPEAWIVVIFVAAILVLGQARKVESFVEEVFRVVGAWYSPAVE